MDLFSDKSQPMDVGSRLRQLRSERGKSMRALARASGLSTNALSMIERGRTSPSVSTLFKLADALEIPITAFFRLQPEKKEIVFLKAGSRDQLQIPDGIWEDLGGQTFAGNTEAFMMTVDPGASSGSFGMIHSGEEFVLCLSGRLRYSIKDQQYCLEPGDSVLFAGHLQHQWRNISQETARMVIVISGFEHGERPAEFHIASQVQPKTV